LKKEQIDVNTMEVDCGNIDYIMLLNATFNNISVFQWWSFGSWIYNYLWNQALEYRINWERYTPLCRCCWNIAVAFHVLSKALWIPMAMRAWVTLQDHLIRMPFLSLTFNMLAMGIHKAFERTWNATLFKLNQSRLNCNTSDF
jgi:hypothetical protein